MVALRERRRRAVSPVIATVVLVAIAISVGAGLWSYANSSTGATLAGEAERAAMNINELNEKFIIFHFNVTTTGANDTITAWFYNHGDLDTQIVAVLIWENVTRGRLQRYDSTSNPGLFPTALPKGQVVALNLTYNRDDEDADNLDEDGFFLNRTYFVQAVALYGNTYTYSQPIAKVAADD